jgi:anti-anti-sigma regulatory factor
MAETPKVPVSRIVLEGEYDLTQKAAVALLFGELQADGPAIIDLTKVTYVDSSFLNELAVLRARLKEHAITLVGATGSVMRVLKLVEFDKLFHLVDS